MNQFPFSRRKRFAFLLIPMLIGAAYLGSAVLSSSPKKDARIVKVNNLSRSCELLIAERHNGHVKLLIQNNSNKAITAYALTSNTDARTVFTFEEEFATSEGDFVIPSGQSHETVIAIPGSIDRQAEVILNFSAVIFEDKTSEGDEVIIRGIEDNRLGQKIQFMKALPVLDKFSRLSDTEIAYYWTKAAGHDFEVALNAPDAELLEQLNKKSPNNRETHNESEQFEEGSQYGKGYTFRTYQELKDAGEKAGAVDLRDRIIRVRDFYAKMIARL